LYSGGVVGRCMVTRLYHQERKMLKTVNVSSPGPGS
jgi:hypothetical protein